MYMYINAWYIHVHVFDDIYGSLYVSYKLITHKHGKQNHT